MFSKSILFLCSLLCSSVFADGIYVSPVTLPVSVLNGGTGVTTSTGTGSTVLSNTPTLVTPVLGVATGTSLTASSFLAAGTTPAVSGPIRIPGNNAAGVRARNAANSADLDVLFVDTTDTAFINIPLRVNGALTQSKVAASGTSPGAGVCKIESVTGTTGSSCKLIVSCGTSATTVTIVDNIGTGC